MNKSSNVSKLPKDAFISLLEPTASTSNSSNVEMAESMTKVEESLECPVCYKIPRNLPISCCEAGHIICQSCRSRVTTCPTCRGSLDSNNTSSLAGRQIMLVKHKCKFSFYGCETKMKLEQIIVHEETCPERTVTCPGFECNDEVQMKKFNEHVTKEKCSLPMWLWLQVIAAAPIKLEVQKIGKKKMCKWVLAI